MTEILIIFAAIFALSFITACFDKAAIVLEIFISPLIGLYVLLIMIPMILGYIMRLLLTSKKSNGGTKWN